MNVRIIGNGVWGKAMCHVLSQNCKDVSIAKRGEITENADVTVFCVPTQSIRDAAKTIKNPKIIVNTAKGIEMNTHKFPYEIVRGVLGEKIEYYSLIGPSFAEEVTNDMPTLVNLGYVDMTSHTELVRNLFQTNYFRVKPIFGVEVLELSGALKNVYAIVCGLATGLGFETNTRVKLIVLAIEEMQRIFGNLNFSVETNATAGTIGDLILTCNSEESRNFRFGKLLATEDKEKILETFNGTIEGYHTLESIPHL